jgi:hypothetical protein
MPIPEGELKALTAHLQKHSQGMNAPACPVCANRHWTAEGPVAPILYTASPINPAQGEMHPSKNLPLFALCCTTCFYVMFFSSVAVMRGNFGGK